MTATSGIPGEANGGQGAAPLSARRVLSMSVGVTAAGMIPVWLVGGLAVQMRADLGFDEFQLGLTTALFFGVSAVVSMPGSRLVERTGWRRGIAMTGLVSAIGLLAIAGLVRTWWMLLLAMAVLACGNATAQPSANLVLARTVSAERRGLAFGIKQAGMPLTAMTAGLAVPLLAVTVGWRWAFVAVAGIGLGLLALLPRGPRPASSAPQPRVRLGRGGDAPVRALVLLAVAGGFATASSNALGSFMVSYSVVEGMSPGAAGWLFAGASGLGLVVRIVAGWRADRRNGGHFRFCVLMLSGGSLGFVLFAIGGSTLVLALAAAACFGLGWSWNGVYTYAVMEANQGSPAAATGVLMVAKFIGGTTGPLVFGLLVSQVSYAAGWLMTAGLMVLAAVHIQLARRLLRRSRREALAGMGPLPA